MKQAVMLSLRGQQNYLEQEPEIISLITEGTLKKADEVIASVPTPPPPPVVPEDSNPGGGTLPDSGTET